jgi:hypothetical protein
MDLTLTPRVKVIALAGILAAVVMVGGMQVLAHRQASAASAPLPTIVHHVVHAPPAVAPKPKPAHKAATHVPATTAKKHLAPHKARTAAAKPAAKPKPAATPTSVTVGSAPATTTPATPAAPATPAPTVAADATVSPGLPGPLAAELRKFPVVVIAIYDPQSQVDAIAFAEAEAGAKTAGAGFLPVNVLDEKVVAPITALLPGGGLLPDPGVLVFQRPGTLVNQFNGFADRDMVAQAAVNAVPHS